MFEFDPQDAYRFAQEQGITARRRGDELIFKMCPYCRRTENSNQKTFSINLQTGVFNCFRSSCGAHGNMIILARDFDFELSNSAANEYYHLGNNRRRYRRLVNKHPETKDFAVQYMVGRGISEEVTRKYNITEREDHPGVLVFPFYDETNTLQFVKYRNTDKEQIEKYGKEYSEKDCKPILFGMNHCNPKLGPLILTEGQIDSLSCATAGIYNAVSVPTGANGFTWVPYCWDFLKKFKTLIVFGDHEKGHITLLDEMVKRFMGSVKHVREEDYQGCKDANELLQTKGAKAVKDAIENAVLVDIPDIVDLSKVETVQPELREQISTGYNHLNRIIGGFFVGQLGILTGKAGLGKSTVASMFVINAVIQGWNVFYYSGELSNANVREWLELQIVGSGKTAAYDINGKVFYKVRPEYSQAAANWYRGKIYTKAELNYSDDMNDGIQERKLPEIITDAIVKYGCKFIVLDNLMTAMSDDLSSDKYREQSVFIKKLTFIVQKYQVFILLVAHPRKGGAGPSSNDDIAGSSDIGNLTSLIMEYTRPQKGDDEPEEVNRKRRIMRVTKNRLTGDLDERGFELYYEPSSKRISEYPNGTKNQFYLNVNLRTADETEDGFLGLPEDDTDTPW